MPSKEKKQKYAVGAAAGVGLFLAGKALYKEMRSKASSSRQPCTQPSASIRSVSGDTPTVPKSETKTNERPNEYIQKTFQDHDQKASVTDQSDCTQGLWYNRSRGCWVSLSDGNCQIRNGKSFGDPDRTADMRGAELDLQRLYRYEPAW